MDPADSAAVKEALTHQGILLGQHEQALNSLSGASRGNQDQLSQLHTLVISLTSQVSQLMQVVPPRAPSPPAAAPRADLPEVSMPTPEVFTGDTEKCRGFIMQCTNVFAHRAVSFASDEVKVSYLVGLLRGRALEWAEARLCGGTELPASYVDFLAEFRGVFDHPSRSSEAAHRLNELRQGRRTVADYAIDFRTLAVESGWNDAALRSRFVCGLQEQLRDELVFRDEPSSLEPLIALCIRLDSRLRERRAVRDYPSQQARSQPTSSFQLSHRRASPPPPPLAASGGAHAREEPMQVGHARVSITEMERRRQEGDCFYCGQRGHSRATCPTRPKGNAHQ